ncbi:MAG: hypothetical protein OXG60_15435 [Chloroflexi bacterium]|nr:hypothetical protein [Chloroflexota bacterium]
MIRLLLYAFVSAALGAVAGILLAAGLPEGAIAGAVVGASVGVIIGMHRAGAASPAFEYEAAGLHDDNLITTARRNLVREAYRDSYDLRERDAQWAMDKPNEKVSVRGIPGIDTGNR